MAMNLYLKWACRVIIVILALNLTACAAAPLPADGIQSLYQGMTLYGIEKALAGAPETFIMRSALNPNLFIVSWHVPGSGWAFVLLDANGTAKTWQSVAGNIGTPKTLNELVDGAIALRFVFVKNLSDASLALCRGYEIAKNWIGQTANSMPVILVAPVGAFEIPGILPTPSGIQE
jgi:hypothetical protein